MIKRLIVGAGCLIFGLVIYPYYVTYFVTPVTALINSMFPSLNLWQNAFINSLPLGVMLLIIFCAVMHFLGKASSEAKGD
jgi:hypothetical protein